MRKHQVAVEPRLSAWTTPPTSANSTPPRTQPKLPSAKQILLSRLNAKVLSPSRILSEPQSQISALCISPTSQLAYKLVKVLQSAIYGGVFLAESFYIAAVLRLKPGQPPPAYASRVAIKIMLREVEKRHKDNSQENIGAELQFQDRMRGHKNVLAYQELWESQSKGIVYVVMPYAEYEDLFEVMKKRVVPFQEAEARWLFKQILEGSKYLHRRGVGFRDHSLENILLFRGSDGHTLCPRITDPGQAVLLKHDAYGNVADQYAVRYFGKSFRPPEVYSFSRLYNPIKVDTFCLGWMLFFVVTKRQPFDRSTDSDPHYPYIKQGRIGELLKLKGAKLNLSADLIDLLNSMMQHDYTLRPTIDECLRHTWFQAECVPITDATVRGPLQETESEQRQQHHHQAASTQRVDVAAGTKIQ